MTFINQEPGSRRLRGGCHCHREPAHLDARAELRAPASGKLSARTRRQAGNIQQTVKVEVVASLGHGGEFADSPAARKHSANSKSTGGCEFGQSPRSRRLRGDMEKFCHAEICRKVMSLGSPRGVADSAVAWKSPATPRSLVKL